jgi:hypothetical protein
MTAVEIPGCMNLINKTGGSNNRAGAEINWDMARRSSIFAPTKRANDDVAALC